MEVMDEGTTVMYIDVDSQNPKNSGDGSLTTSKGHFWKNMSEEDMHALLGNRETINEAQGAPIAMNALCWNVQGLGNPWTFKTLNRIHTWSLLRRISSMYSGPWVVGGDFNEILRDSEQSSDRERPNYLIKYFRATIDDCCLKEIEDDGTNFSWCSRRQNGMVYAKLDRVLGNIEWLNRFVLDRVDYLQWWNSDHRPMLLKFNEVSYQDKRRVKWYSRLETRK
ncbi:hypothetical protein POM88_011989 [Heracleum sosnowskyi]|uniref:Endonuclease/exonuclease/phosphatase domain-containing protein n=1 Tax=Heracleum sosnowskyi TaxID=360622 RepID=A0AAD8IX78_9APIA|nr:hypothetical protein POM88_011989 [Heracleum sosnowskyi]